MYSMNSLMAESGVKFGTSGARGLVVAMTDKLCFLYTQAFIQHLEESGQEGTRTLGVGGDLRSSSPRIAFACGQAALQKGWKVEFMGFVPSPAVALRGIEAGMATAMVTGSHIPEDRNGIKFNTPAGEITKLDEGGILKQTMSEVPEGLFDSEGMFAQDLAPFDVNPAGLASYKARYLDFFGADALAGLKLGVYQHSTVGREVIAEVLESLGAKVTRLGFSDTFISVDTEAIRPEDRALAKGWAGELDIDAIVSADGDADRPLLSDEKGEWLPGDVLGILAARFLKIQGIATPVSCNTALEKCGEFPFILRTKIGSPFVIAAMEELMQNPELSVAGYEANGGFLLGSALKEESKTLAPLATRDVLLPVIAVLRESLRQKQAVSVLASQIPPRFTAADRLKEFPTEISKEILKRFEADLLGEFTRTFASLNLGNALSVDQTDGLRCEFSTLDVLHLRPSGNAPEFRCYVESATREKALELLEQALKIMESWRN